MSREEAESELMQIYGMLSEEKKQAIDVLMAQADEEKTCGTCRNNDTYHCAECENKSDYEQSQADGEYISRTAIEYINAPIAPVIQGEEVHYEWVAFRKQIEQLPSVDIPPEHDGCKDCKHQDKSEDELPCHECQQNYKDKWEKAPQWIHTEECDEEFPYRCSKCNLPSRSNGHRYCPNCGSYMYGHLRKFRMR